MICAPVLTVSNMNLISKSHFSKLILFELGFVESISFAQWCASQIQRVILNANESI